MTGLKSSRPAAHRAVTISGEATKACVDGLESLREVKLRLYDVMMLIEAGEQRVLMG